MTETETLFNGRWLRLKRRGTWEFCERVTPAGAVIVVAITDADEIVFVEQYREPIRQKTIEMPAGLIGDLDEFAQETAIESAHRELEEETGYRAARIELIMGGPVSAGLTTETATFVRATGLVRVSAGGGDPGEDIIVHVIPRAECPQWLMQKAAEGYSMDPKLYAGLYFAERDARGKPW